MFQAGVKSDTCLEVDSMIFLPHSTLTPPSMNLKHHSPQITEPTSPQPSALRTTNVTQKEITSLDVVPSRAENCVTDAMEGVMEATHSGEFFPVAGRPAMMPPQLSTTGPLHQQPQSVTDSDMLSNQFMQLSVANSQPPSQNMMTYRTQMANIHKHQMPGDPTPHMEGEGVGPFNGRKPGPGMMPPPQSPGTGRGMGTSGGMMSNTGMPDDMLDMEVQDILYTIPQHLVLNIKREANVENKDFTALSPEEKRRVVHIYHTLYASRAHGGPPQTVLQSQQQFPPPGPPSFNSQPTPQSQGPTPQPGMTASSSSTLLTTPLHPPPQQVTDMFSDKFMQSVANQLKDFDMSLFRPDGDINFERDFGQWFNDPGDVAGLDIKLERRW
ncbi:hypothetical protein VNI00_019193 [Paramarasmius palmivorus]|uniref:Uncharacterized protein n=1 Tax=Paramarasmius palmivorus TaxID=297713 RepID=A0AAW0AQ75_9AGAR